MNKTAIKNFAVWARNKLIADITYKAGLLGVNEKGIAEPLPQSSKDLQFFDIGTKDYAQVAGSDIEQRNALVRAIQEKERTSDYKTAFKAVIEEVAYTWFNRLIAIRFMEVNEYLPSRIRVLSSENPAKNEPDFVTTPFDTDMEFTIAEQDQIMQLKDENKLDELFRMLFIKQCNKLHEILPELFEETNNYTELLLSISFTDKDGIVYHLVHDIPEDDFNVEKEGQVEIIGWMYQYYISEKHDQIINIYKGTVKKEDIPAATQLFTTDWVVRYMVDNSLGRYWIERHPESNLADKLDFFVTPKNGKITYINEKIEPEELTFFDPCMGSGHILVYAFDVLMEIYREAGYTDRDAALSILENNLFGLDIDQRAYQLAYFAVMMKARSYNRRIFSRDVKCNVAVINESNGISKFAQANVTLDRKQNEIGEYLIDVFRHAKEIGSLQTVAAHDYDAFSEYVDSCEVAGQMDLLSAAWSMHTAPMVRKLVEQAKILSRKYTVVCTNPPYMCKFEANLKEFINDRYKLYSGDLFSAFIYRNFGFCKENGYSAFMTPFLWMFIKTYEALRNFVVDRKAIVSLVQMEYSAFEEATVPICSFVLKNGESSEKSLCIKLSEFRGGMEVQKIKVLEAIENKSCDYFYEVDASNFGKIPGSPLAFWGSSAQIDVFERSAVLSSLANPRQGLITGDVNRFVRKWYECSSVNLNLHGKKNEEDRAGKWFPYCNGGGFRKWYGNNEDVVNWYLDGIEVKGFTDEKGKQRSRPQNQQFYFQEGGTWSAISSSSFSVRYFPEGFLFSNAGMAIYTDSKKLKYIIGFLNSKLCQMYLGLFNEGLNYNQGDIAKLPILIDEMDNVVKKTEEIIAISKNDWDSFETSWDFLVHPLVLAAEVPDFDGGHKATLADSYVKWEALCEKRFNQLKANEEELNRVFIDIYGLQDELTPEVEDKDVTVRKADLSRDIRSLLSYAVGCMFGRYSLDQPGLVYAGGEWSNSKYSTFIPDKDNCIPITDEAYFEDDLVGQFVGWMKKAFGEENLEVNLEFIAKALGNKGTTSREVIRNYFLNDFMKDHIKMYQKRPIYWLFDSGKQDGFKALVYMHRWNADTVGNLRVEYLHKMQHTYEREIVRMQETIDNSRDSREVSKATKRKDKLQKQLKETKDYDAKLAHIALSRIEIDLDDGVKVNYEKVQTGRDGKKMQILAKI
ncbi:MAG: BREX-1 system adenine-specific DNA-methyltransferase PglX [Clostridiales bacterium]|nr:BREX-1 system adenine-specific DNA-methyltransferase PglX [Clostridiales bacterium]